MTILRRQVSIIFHISYNCVPTSWISFFSRFSSIESSFPSPQNNLQPQLKKKVKYLHAQRSLPMKKITVLIHLVKLRLTTFFKREGDLFRLTLSKKWNKEMKRRKKKKFLIAQRWLQLNIGLLFPLHSIQQSPYLVFLIDLKWVVGTQVTGILLKINFVKSCRKMLEHVWATHIIQ